MDPPLLHGTLHVTIYEIDRLRGGWGLNRLRRKVFGSKVYATIDLERARVGTTRTIETEPSNPRWYQNFHIYCAHMVSNIVFTVKNDDLIGATLIGRAYLPVEEIIRGHMFDRWIEILDEDQNPISGGSKIHVKLQFLHVTQEKNWSRGINSPKFGGVINTFFQQRHECLVTLYSTFFPKKQGPVTEYVDARLGDEYDHFTPQRCWEDIFDAINDAKHLIYIAGWSINTEITLLRDPDRRKPGGDVTLGQLLKKKADQGVNVLLLVWDDTNFVQEFKRDGLVATHNQETKDYFRNTNVRCVLCPRKPEHGKKSLVQGFKATMFTHHQNMVVVDSELQGSFKRSIVSFVGGLDLCNARFDSDTHSTWHDIHCRLEGPVACDVLYNFEQRWRRQVGDQYIYSPHDLDEFITRPMTVKLSDDSESWNVQVFRSIDGSSTFDFPIKPDEEDEIGVIDHSIQDAYINAIRRAKNFIYIENQYFVGSSYGWKRSPDMMIEDVNALHLIPMELSLKIVSKIEAGERFVAYIVIPMWPEGKPESSSVQEILDWQRRTMEMMYIDISKALVAKGLAGVELRDYLTFFCLGNREQNSGRSVIRVHSKMMIVDDEYVIIGSANINQRSMDGARDTEIAMGGFQPHHLANEKRARGKIFGFRKRLWMEQLEDMDLYNSDADPESLECVRRINQRADENWNQYARQDMVLNGCLHRYPVNVSENGEITALSGLDLFPDTKASVLGTKLHRLPPILTT